MTRFTLHYAPTTCGDVTLIALEHIGASYDLEMVRMVKKQQLTPDYLAMNPKGKAPTLLVDGEALTETPAILCYLARAHPEANLLPFGQGALRDAQVASDLDWVAAGIHPFVNRIFLPMRTCDVEGGPARVREMAKEGITRPLAILNDRLSGQRWFHPDWSALDAFVYWVFNRLELVGVDLAPYPNLIAHGAAMKEVPAVQRAWAVRERFIEQLEDEGNFFSLPPV